MWVHPTRAFAFAGRSRSRFDRCRGRGSIELLQLLGDDRRLQRDEDAFLRDDVLPLAFLESKDVLAEDARELSSFDAKVFVEIRGHLTHSLAAG